MGRQSVRLQMTSKNRQVPQDQGPPPPPARETELRQGQEEHVIRLIAVNGRQIFKGARLQTRRAANGTFPLLPVQLYSDRFVTLSTGCSQMQPVSTFHFAQLRSTQP